MALAHRAPGLTGAVLESDDVIVELMGGEAFAGDCVERALASAGARTKEDA